MTATTTRPAQHTTTHVSTVLGKATPISALALMFGAMTAFLSFLAATSPTGLATTSFQMGTVSVFAFAVAWALRLEAAVAAGHRLHPVVKVLAYTVFGGAVLAFWAGAFAEQILQAVLR
jgi:hypothetical protein